MGTGLQERKEKDKASISLSQTGQFAIVIIDFFFLLGRLKTIESLK